jgi:acyl-CoA synthetase (AMP-forming)/AMP-acid ligase II
LLVQVPNGIELAASVLGAMLVGATPVLCEPGLGPAVYRDRVRAANPSWLLVTPLVEGVKGFPGLPAFLKRLRIDVPPLVPGESRIERVFVLREPWERFLRRAGPRIPRDRLTRLPSRDAMIAFTGGTTSQPKGVRFSHAALNAYFENLAHLVGDLCPGPLPSILADTPAQVFHALRHGATAYIAKGKPNRRAISFLRLIRQEKVSAYFGSPFIWQEMMRLQGARPLPPSLRLVLLGSSPVTRTFLRDLTRFAHPSTTIACLYGLTEAGPVSVAKASDKLEFDGPGDLVGEPVAGVTVSLSEPAEGLEFGEIVVRGSCLFSGYLGQPDRAAAEGLRTGDLGRWANHGQPPKLVLMGRKKDMIIRRSVNIYPTTIEPSLRELTDDKGKHLFVDVALVGVWNPTRQDEDLVLCYALPKGSSIPTATIKTRVERAVGTDVAPDFYLALDRLPVTGRQNKIDKNALRELAAKAYR